MKNIFQGSSGQLELLSLSAATPGNLQSPPQLSQSPSVHPQQLNKMERPSVADFGIAHWPDTQNSRFFKYTEHHLAYESRLSPCASLLYKWLLLKGPAGHSIRGEFESEFQAFLEQWRGQPYSYRQIARAKTELRKLGLYESQKSSKIVTVTHCGPVTTKQPQKRK